MNIFLCILIIVFIIFSKIIFKINYKKAKSLQENEDLSEITNKLPENIEIAKDILQKLNNNDVKIEEAKNTQTSLYIAITNKISIADMKKNYARLQTIAHECIHSVQDRRLLLTNFIFSNIVIIYFIAIFILACFNIINNISYAFIFLIMLLMQYAVRSYLEIDAMTKAKYISKEYLESKTIISKDETQKLLLGYEEINKTAIPFVIDNLLMNALLKLLILMIGFAI